MAAILVIDDSPTVRVSLKLALDLDGHDVMWLNSVTEMAGHLRDGLFDLILLDLQMPTFSGLSLGALLRSYDKKETPMVIYSSRPVTELRAVAEKLNAAAIFEKTRPISDLRTLITQVLATAK